MKDVNKFYYSEIFGDTIQGEGLFTGIPTVWIRYFLCNLECRGFGQVEPSKPETWEPLVSDKIDLINITDITELPVFERGCDSAYSVAKRYKHLQKYETVEEIVDRIQALLPNGKFVYPTTGQPIHFAFTGGEPMLNQPATIAILNEFKRRDMKLSSITFETNGTRKISKELVQCLADLIIADGLEVLWSVSPKLLHTSGELPKKAMKPENFSDYVWNVEQEILTRLGDDGSYLLPNIKLQVKFVANGKDETWDEITEVLDLLKRYNIEYQPNNKITFWIMPVGGTLEGQLGQVVGHMSAGQVADEAIKRGFNVSARVHNYLWSNVVGK